jgi:flagellar basal-body rod modification protein FlgD
MSSLSSLNGTSVNSAISTTTNSSLNLNSSQFLQLLTTQLKNQDPSDPVSASDFTSQLAQLSTLDSLNSLNTNFSSLLSLQQINNGSNLIGKTVSYTDPNTNNAASGVVSSLAIQSGAVSLSINNVNVPISSILSVQ